MCFSGKNCIFVAKIEDTAMPRKKSGMPFEVYPTPMKGKDGRNILFARPAGGRFKRITEEQIDNYVAKYSLLNRGQLKLVFEEFKHWAAEMLAKGYRIDTPIGSFAPKLRMKGEFTDPDKVGHDDVELDGVDYNPGKIWHEAIGEWMHDGFHKVDRPDASKLLADKERLEQLMRDTIQRHGGALTANTFSIVSGLTYYSARKLLDEWTDGDSPKLQKTRFGQSYIYTEI